MGRFDDETLRARYRAHLERYPRSPVSPAIEPETIQALAAGDYRNPDRLELLDRVLADPALAREYHFFADLVAAAPRPAFQVPRWLALAATIVVAVGAGTWWLKRDLGPEPIRGPERGATIVVPAPDGEVGPGTSLIWRSVDRAVDYRLEVVDQAGDVAYSQTTRDTTLALPATLTFATNGSYLVAVVTRFADGTSSRGTAVRLQAR